MTRALTKSDRFRWLVVNNCYSTETTTKISEIHQRDI